MRISESRESGTKIYQAAPRAPNAANQSTGKSLSSTTALAVADGNAMMVDHRRSMTRLKPHTILRGLLGMTMVCVPSAILLAVLVQPWKGGISDFLLFFGVSHGPGLLVLGVFAWVFSLKPRAGWAWAAGFAGCAALNVALWSAVAFLSAPPPDARHSYFDLRGVLAMAAIPSVAVSAIAGVLFGRLFATQAATD
ncbi:hypothetical protein [Mesorhizobium comanense]|uniref:hypothetical protein n=1 Tax=Mesorhizobium comanense TaxID=2502215 RepID=UPI0010F96189|nr:hypothetical protein [Mesorhizobium comanense]